MYWSRESDGKGSADCALNDSSQIAGQSFRFRGFCGGHDLLEALEIHKILQLSDWNKYHPLKTNIANAHCNGQNAAIPNPPIKRLSTVQQAEQPGETIPLTDEVELVRLRRVLARLRRRD
jgi:hypothetical protein